MSEEQQEYSFTEDELQDVIRLLCTCKVSEFVQLGYEHVTVEDIWRCVSEGYKETGIPPLHRLTNDILSMRVTHLMNWMTLHAYKGSFY